MPAFSRRGVLGLAVPLWSSRPATEVLAVAREALAADLPEVWVGEMSTFDAFAVAAAALGGRQSPSRITVGPVPVGVRDPASLAMGIATVAAAAGRPADIALGAATRDVVTAWHGRPFDHVSERTAETIAALRPVLDGNRSNFDGRHVSTRSFRVGFDVSDSRIAVAAFGARMLEVAATSSDRVVLNFVTPERVTEICARVASAAEHAARPAVPEVVVWTMASFTGNPEALAHIAYNIAIYLRLPSYAQMFEQAGFGEFVSLAQQVSFSELVALLPRSLVSHFVPIGSEADVARRVSEYHAAGAHTVCLVPTTADDPGARAAVQFIHAYS